MAQDWSILSRLIIIDNNKAQDRLVPSNSTSKGKGKVKDHNITKIIIEFEFEF